ncbi:hypothetical protein G7Y89_g8987 [Cudoniella acicularis]|uniref:Uncharacterized protein n=1 Tax=Cudoniella acicularis TaxID=354080 RepID=A0A8H4RJ98_9HELO|nr:hypothetical protein G7Y89_g8987 [Cudoniella acicularis]
MLTHTVILLSLAARVSTLTTPQQWDTFTNNFATDLAPVIVLFGEQVSKQFLSESTSFWDNIIFGIAPIGVLTAIVSAIRLYGDASLKAFIGRAQEAHGEAEAELCSSTKHADGGEEKEGDEDDMTIYPESNWTEIPPRSPQNQRNAMERAKLETFAPHPNLGLNIGIKGVPSPILPVIAVVGICLQASFFVYATWATFYDLALYEDGDRPSLWSFCLATSGTASLVLGMILCALLIERMSTERRFRQNSTGNTVMFWLQPGGQRVGDQLFNAFAYSEEKKEFMTSWKADLVSKIGVRDTKSTLVLWVALISSTCGFICQFVGFRGLHGSIALYQLAITLCMAITRALLRFRRLNAEQNRLKARVGIEGHELDWQAFNLENPHKESSQGWFIVDDPTPLEKPESLKDNTLETDEGVDLASRGKQIVSFRIRDGRDIDSVRCAQQAVTWASSNEANGDQPNEAAKLMHYRSRLAYLTGDAIQAADQRWDTEVRDMAMHLQEAIQESAGYIFSNMKLLKGWRDSHALAWSTTCFMHEPPRRFSQDPIPPAPALSVHFLMFRNAGVWEISKYQLEAVLGLWHWSLKQLDYPEDLFRRKIFMLGQQSKRNDLASAIRLWVTQTHHIYPDPVQPPYSPSPNPPTGLFQVPITSPTPLDDFITSSGSHYPTTLSVSLRTALGPTQEDGQADPTCLSIPTKSSLLQLIAQDIFAIFITRVAGVLERLEGVEPWTGQGQTTTIGIGGTLSDQPYRGIMNAHVQTIADIFVSSGLGSREDALASVIPPLLQRSKLPDLDEVTETLLSAAKSLRRNSKFEQGENLLRWLLNSLPPRFQERADRFEKAGNSGGRQLSDLEKVLKDLDSQPPRPLGLTLAYEFKLTGATPHQVLHILKWAVRVKCPELVEDLWKDPRDLVNKIDDENLPPLFWAIGENFEEETFQSLLEWPKVNVNLRGRNGKTPLILASEEGNTKAVDLLLQHGALTELADLSGDTALRLAVENKHEDVVKRLLQAGADILAQIGTPYTTVLHTAVELSPGLVELLLKYRADTELRDRSNRTPLFVAALKGDYKSADLLLKYGADAEAKNKNNKTALQVAVERGYETVVARLLDANANANANIHDETSTALLHAAAASGAKTVVELLLKHEANTEAEDENGRTPLLVALEKGHEEVAELLLLGHANPNTPGGSQKSSPLHLAVQSGSERIVNLLLENKADIESTDAGGQPALIHAVKKDRGKIIKLLLDAKANANARDGEGNTALHLATQRNSYEVVDLMLSHGAELESKDSINRTPLILALEIERDRMSSTANGVRVVKRLLEAGANSNAQWGDHGSALHLAVQGGSKCLLRAGADPSARGGEYGNPLQAASYRAQEEIVKQLLLAGADVNSEGGIYGHALQAAVAAWSGEEVVEMLLVEGADMNAAGGKHKSALHAALKCGRKKVLSLLLKQGANPESEDDMGRTALLSAIESGDKKVVLQLLKHQAETESTDREGRTALLAAVDSGDKELVKLLLQYHARTDAKDKLGRTPFLLAVEKSHDEIAELLLEAKSDVNVEGGRYGNALQAALYKGDRKMVEQLRAAGARRPIEWSSFN